MFKEEALVRRVKGTGNLLELVAAEIVRPLQARREALGEPLVSLLHVEVLNPFVHTHNWQHTYSNKSSQRSFYVCQHCEATGYIPINIMTGETAKHVIRDEKFKGDKWDVCRDQLPKLAHKLNFR